MITGCMTALVTPFRTDGSIDEEGLRRNVRFQEEKGIRYLVPCGSTGESATLDHVEHLRVLEIVIDEAKKAKVVAGTGSNATSEAIQLSKGAQDLGADALLSVAPYYNKPTQTGLIKHFEAIAHAVKIPMIVYNIPSRTGSNITAQTMVQLSSVPGIAGVKEASGDLNQMANIIARAPKDFCVLSGDDSLTLPLMALGGNGVISVSSNIVPDQMNELTNSMLDGDLPKAREIHYRLLPLFSVLSIETNPIPVKTAMRSMGMPSGPFRLPLCDMGQSNLDALKKVLIDIRLM